MAYRSAVGRLPAEHGLVRRLRQERGDLALQGVGVGDVAAAFASGGAEVGEVLGRGDQAVVRVEVLAGAQVVVVLLQHLLELGL